MLTVSGCGTSSLVIQSECLWVEIIRPTNADVDVISNQLVEQLLRHNELVELEC